MLNSIEARRVGARRTSEQMSLGRDNSEFSAPDVINQQAAWLTARYPLGDVQARVIAEHAFARGPQR